MISTQGFSLEIISASLDELPSGGFEVLSSDTSISLRGRAIVEASLDLVGKTSKPGIVGAKFGFYFGRFPDDNEQDKRPLVIEWVDDGYEVDYSRINAARWLLDREMLMDEDSRLLGGLVNRASHMADLCLTLQKLRESTREN